MRLSDYPFLKYLPFLIFGILIGERNWIDAPLSWVIVLSLWGIYSWIRFTYRNFPVRFSFMPYLILIFLGIHLGQSKSKIQVYGSEELLEIDSYLAKVRRFDVPKPNSSGNLLEDGGPLRPQYWFIIERIPASCLVNCFGSPNHPIRFLVRFFRMSLIIGIFWLEMGFIIDNFWEKMPKR